MPGRSDSHATGVRKHVALARLVGESEAFREVIDKLSRAARSDCTVLIQGESGTGKGVCARAIHDLSAREDRPFIWVNCGALPDKLIESELFGHVRGAFTDATDSRAGLVEEARGGTMFLDEVGALPLGAQVKLLRLLQEREFRRVGSTKTLKADIRLIAATNTDMKRAVEARRIREDFYYRLSVFPVNIPPLRERQADIMPLARHFLRKFAAESPRPAPVLSEGAEAKLRTYDWPGNVRELENAIEGAVVRAGEQNVITERQLVLGDPGAPFEPSLREVRDRAERAYVEQLLMAHRGDVNQAVSSAKTSLRTMRRLIRKHDINLDKYRAGSPQS